MFAAAALALLVTLALAVARAALGPTVFDRAQAVNTVGTACIIAAQRGFAVMSSMQRSASAPLATPKTTSSKSTPRLSCSVRTFTVTPGDS